MWTRVLSVLTHWLRAGRPASETPDRAVEPALTMAPSEVAVVETGAAPVEATAPANPIAWEKVAQHAFWTPAGVSGFLSAPRPGVAALSGPEPLPAIPALLAPAAVLTAEISQTIAILPVQSPMLAASVVAPAPWQPPVSDAATPIAGPRAVRIAHVPLAARLQRVQQINRPVRLLPGAKRLAGDALSRATDKAERSRAEWPAAVAPSMPEIATARPMDAVIARMTFTPPALVRAA